MGGKCPGRMRKMTETSRKSNLGGKRPGAGRPPLIDGKSMSMTSVRLPEKTIAAAREIGGGKLSLGIHLAVDAWGKTGEIAAPLDEATLAVARELGNGDVSAGIREALRRTNGIVVYLAEVVSDILRTEGNVTVQLINNKPTCLGYIGQIFHAGTNDLWLAAFELAARKAGFYRENPSGPWKACPPANRHAFIRLHDDGSFEVEND